MNRYLTFIFSFALIFSSVKASSENARSLVEQDTNKIISIVSDKALQGDTNKEKRRDLISQILEKRFDFVEMSKRAVGRDWKNASDPQKKEFTDLFKKLLEKTYIEKMERYSGEKIRMGKEEKIDDSKVSVETFITMKSGDVLLVYKLVSKGSDWLVYDVIIEGVGLIQNYRTQFKKILEDKNFDALIQNLKEKNNAQP